MSSIITGHVVPIVLLFLHKVETFKGILIIDFFGTYSILENETDNGVL